MTDRDGVLQDSSIEEVEFVEDESEETCKVGRNWIGRLWSEIFNCLCRRWFPIQRMGIWNQEIRVGFFLPI